MDYNLTFKVNKTTKTFDVKAKNFLRGKDEVLFDSTLFSNYQLLENGYIVEKFSILWKNKIENSIKQFVLEKMKKAGITIQYPELFSLDQYHKFVTDDQHKEIVNSFRAGFFGIGGIDLDLLGIESDKLDDFINKAIQSNRRVSCKVKKFGLTHAKFWIRIVRPLSNDNNPPHKDSHLKRLRKNVNVYLPLAGSNEHSSLPLIPKSHLEPESEYIVSSSPSFVNNKKNTVPCIVHRNKGLNMICPDPQFDEILIFTPHIIHGGGINFNKKLTRVSLEMRFFEQT